MTAFVAGLQAAAPIAGAAASIFGGGGGSTVPNLSSVGPTTVNVGAPVFPSYPFRPDQPGITASLGVGTGSTIGDQVITGVIVAGAVAVLLRIIRK